MKKPKLSTGTLYSDENVRIQKTCVEGEFFYKTISVTDSKGIIVTRICLYADGDVKIEN